MAQVFISYSRRDTPLVSSIHEALRRAGRDTCVAWEEIAPTTERLAERRTAIESCDNFLFVMSPDSTGSSACLLELEHAVLHRKRLIPIIARTIRANRVPAALASLNWIFFDDSDHFDRSMDRLLEALDTDFDWVRAHTRLLVRARRWEGKSRHRAFLLRGPDLHEAEGWLASAALKKDSLPTALHAEYITTSRKAAAQRLQALLTGVTTALVVSIVLTVVAFIQ